MWKPTILLTRLASVNKVLHTYIHTTPTFVPVLFHNLEGYDSHLFIKSLGGRISCIPKTDEKYISFSKNAVMGTAIDIEEKEYEKELEIRFLDSLKFTLKGLDGLAKGLASDQFKH